MIRAFLLKKVTSKLERITSLAVFSLLIFYAGQLFADPPHKVSETPHNLSSVEIGLGFGSNVSEVCVFCHTPHNGNLPYPLWNRYSTVENTFTLYSSHTLDADMPADLPSDSVSRLCLSCHDGVTALNSLVRYGSFGFKPIMSGSGEKLSDAPGNTADLGTSLRDDHPIGFDYEIAWSREAVKGNSLKPITTVQKGGLKFFGPNNNMLECPTCHDPHVDYDFVKDVYNPLANVGDIRLRPFLRIPNESSQLCFTCHDK